MRLLVRPPPAEAECLPDYAARLAALNGLRRSNVMYRELCRPQGVRQRLDVSNAPLLGLDLRKVAGAMRWRGVHFAPSDLLRRRAGICSLCLAEDGVRPLVWRCRWVVVCIRHRVLLTDQCPGCGAAHALLTDTATHCRCGFDLRQSPPPPPVSERWWSFHLAVHAAFANHARLPFLQSIDHPAAPLLCAPGGLALLRHTLVLIEQVGARCRGPTHPTVQFRLIRVQSLAALLQQGEDGLVEAWQRRLSQLFGAQHQGQRRSSDFDSLRRIHRWCIAIPADSPLRVLGQRLLDAWQVMEQAAALAPPRHGGNADPHAALLSLRESSQRYGIAEPLLRSLVDGRQVPAQRGRRCGRGRARMVSAAVVGELCAFRLKLLRRTEVATFLDISVRQVGALVRMGVLRCAWGKVRSHYMEIPLEQITRLLERLGSLALPFDAHVPGAIRPLAGLVNHQSAGLNTFAATVLAALRGQVKVYRVAHAARGLRQWVVAVDGSALTTATRK